MGSRGRGKRRSPSGWAAGRAPGRIPTRREPARWAARVWKTARVPTEVAAQAAEEPFREAPGKFVARAARQLDRQDDVVPFLLGLQVLHDLADLLERLFLVRGL